MSTTWNFHSIKKATGYCIMLKKGIFTKVIHGGVVKAGLAIERECVPLHHRKVVPSKHKGEQL